MFHRIKSESQSTHPADEAQNTVANQDVKPEETAVESSQTDIETYAAQAEESQAQAQESTETTEVHTEQSTEVQDQTPNTTTEEKDESSMTENTTQEQPETQDDAQAYRAPTPAAGGYAYTSNFAAPSSAAAEAESVQDEAATPSMSSGEDRQLVIGRGITMSGEIEACDNLVVEGTVEASLKGASVLTIAESGTFYGAVEIQDATISGRFEGDIAVSGRLTITESGQVTGSIAYGELQMEAGAIVDGKLTPMKQMASATKRPASKPAAKVASQTPQQVPANNEDGQLFAKA